VAKMNRKAGTTDLFIFMIVAFAIILISVIFIYLGGRVTTEVHSKLDNMDLGVENSTQIVDKTLGAVDNSYQSLYWISWFLIIGMILGTFIGSYLVTTKPIFFIPYIFIVIIAIFVAVAMSSAYETIMTNPEMATIFAGMIASNFIMLKLPIIISIIGITGAIIMFVRMGSGDTQVYGGYQ
jgi:hypothetical protein